VREAQARQRAAERRAQEIEEQQRRADLDRTRQQVDEMADEIVAEAQTIATRYRIDAADLAEEFDFAVRRWEKNGSKGPEPKLKDIAARLSRHQNAAAVERRKDPTTRPPVTMPRSGGRGAPARTTPIKVFKKDGSRNSDAIAADLERRRGMRAG
jgi:hypothetical protein